VLADEIEAVQLMEDVEAGDVVRGVFNEAGGCVGEEGGFVGGEPGYAEAWVD
jgi:hypothetical protein